MPNMKNYDAIIFDVDGTLWNASAGTAKAWNIALQDRCILSSPLSAEDIEQVAGHPIEQCAAMLLPNIPPGELPNLVQMLIFHEKQIVGHEGGRLYEGVMTGIIQLAHSYPLYLISNCQEWYLECFLEHSRLRTFFSGWDCYGTAHLPKSGMIKRMTDKYGLNKVIYIGDTQGDKQATEAANIDFGYVTYGFGRLTNSELTFSSFHQLVEFFLEHTRQ